MKMLALLAFPIVLALATAPTRAQQNVGINLFRGNVTLSGVLCGFNCGSATNTGQATANNGDTIGIRLLGQDQYPAGVLMGAGPAAACPGLSIPGFFNTLLVDPFTMLVAGGTGTLVGASRGSCGETANQVVLSIPLPLLRSGTLVHFQGVVFDAWTPAFTRPVELTIL